MTSQIRRIVLASRNEGKLREIRRELESLAVAVCGLDGLTDAAEPQETGATFAENARLKAIYYAKATGQWCLADDSGLVVDALGGTPGVLSARYAADETPPDANHAQRDIANTAKLLKALAGVPDEKRTARFVCCVAMAAPDTGVRIETQGTIEGRIAHWPSGVNGFGYDPVFFLPQLGCTAAELMEEQKNRISHRGQAVRAFAKRLSGFLDGE